MLMMGRNLQVTTDAYTSCLLTLGEDATDRELLACVASDLTLEDRYRNYASSIFLVYAGAMVFFMQVRIHLSDFQFVASYTGTMCCVRFFVF